MPVRKGRTSRAAATSRLEIGAVAPDFELSQHRGGDAVRLSSFRGQRHVVLAFYPLDWTGV